MSYDIDRLNKLITTPELYLKSREILNEYQDVIDKLMMETVVKDTKELANKLNPETMGDIDVLACEETARRMAKYGKMFFTEEIERLMDSYNECIYENIEYKMRCEILSGLTDSLVNFDPKKLQDNLHL